LNLIVTCGRNLESEAKNEIKKIINELGDQELEILDSGMRGVLTVNTVVKPSEVIDYAKNNKPEAIDILTYMGYSNQARLGRNTNPGMWMTGSTKKLLEKSNEGVIYQDLKACAEYDSGLKSAAKVSATTLLILGKKDFLTPPFKANDLINSFKDPLVKEIHDSGHTLMVESPNTVLDYLIEIL